METGSNDSPNAAEHAAIAELANRLWPSHQIEFTRRELCVADLIALSPSGNLLVVDNESIHQLSDPSVIRTTDLNAVTKSLRSPWSAAVLSRAMKSRIGFTARA